MSTPTVTINLLGTPRHIPYCTYTLKGPSIYYVDTLGGEGSPKCRRLSTGREGGGLGFVDVDIDRIVLSGF